MAPVTTDSWSNAGFRQVLEKCYHWKAGLSLSPASQPRLYLKGPTRELPGASCSSRTDSSSRHTACPLSLSGEIKGTSCARSHTKPNVHFTACTAMPRLISTIKGMGKVTYTQTNCRSQQSRLVKTQKIRLPLAKMKAMYPVLVN